MGVALHYIQYFLTSFILLLVHQVFSRAHDDIHVHSHNHISSLRCCCFFPILLFSLCLTKVVTTVAEVTTHFATLADDQVVPLSATDHIGLYCKRTVYRLGHSSQYMEGL